MWTIYIVFEKVSSLAYAEEYQPGFFGRPIVEYSRNNFRSMMKRFFSIGVVGSFLLSLLVLSPSTVHAVSIPSTVSSASPSSVSSISPQTGSSQGGQLVTIKGKGFTSGTAKVSGVILAQCPNAVAFVALDKYLVINDTTITGRTAAYGNNTCYPVVQFSDGSSTPVNTNVTFQYVTGPNIITYATVTGVSPTEGTVDGGTPITLTGTGFGTPANTPVLGVTTTYCDGKTESDGNALTNVTVVNSTTITATMPASGIGTCQFAVLVTPAPTSKFPADTQTAANPNVTFTYSVGPTIQPNTSVTSITPSTGSTLGGMPVVITGTGFLTQGGGATGATMTYCDGGSLSDGPAFTNFVATSDTLATAVTAPFAAGTCQFGITYGTATNPSITPQNTNATFTYAVGPNILPNASISKISPTSGTTLGGTPVTITGSGFQDTSSGPATSVQLSYCGTAGAPGPVTSYITLTKMTVVSDTTITGVTPAYSAGVCEVIVLFENTAKGTSTQTGSTSVTYTFNTDEYYPPINVTLVNKTGVADSDVYITLDAPAGTTSIPAAEGLPTSPTFNLTSINGGTATPNNTYTFQAGTNSKVPFSGARIYYSFGTGPTQANGWPEPGASPYQYDFTEVTYDSPGDGLLWANLSAVDQTAIPATLEYLDDEGKVMGSRTIGCFTSIQNLFQAGLTKAGLPLGGIQTTAPATYTYSTLGLGTNGLPLVGLSMASKNPSAYPSMQQYVEGLSGVTITETGSFVGSLAGDGSVISPPYLYDYTGTFDSSGNILLTGTLTPVNADGTKGTPFTGNNIFIPGTELYGHDSTLFPTGSGYGVYSQNGPMLTAVTPGGSATIGWTYTGGTLYPLTTIQGGTPIGMNDIYGWMYGDIVAGLSYGYWGGVHGNSSAGYEDGPPPFANSQPTATYPAWNLSEQVISAGGYSNSYGMPLGERFNAGGQPSPLLSMGSVATMRITLLENNGCNQGASLKPVYQNVVLSQADTVNVVPASPEGDLSVEVGDFQEYTAHGFPSAVRYSLSPNILPPGLSFNSHTGAISGKAVGTAAKTRYTVTGTSVDPKTGETVKAQATFFLSVGEETITPSRQTISGQVNEVLTPTKPYRVQGYDGKVVYTISPVLPRGLTMNSSTGVISGTPTTLVTAQPYRVTARNVSRQVPPTVMTSTVLITISGERSLTPATQTVTGVVGTPVIPSTPYVPSAFTGAPVYSISPALPAGLSLNTQTGVISGTPTVAVPQQTFLVTAKGKQGSATATVLLSIASNALSLAPSNQNIRTTVGTYIASGSLAAFGFASTPYYSISPALPSGLSFNARTGVISGTVTAPQSATYTITGTSGVSTAQATVTITAVLPPSPPVTPKPTPASPTVVCLPPNRLFPDGVCGQIA